MRAASGVLIVALLLVAACGAPPSQPAPSTPSSAVPPTSTTSSSSTPTVSPELAAELGPRVELPGGLLLKQIGKTALAAGPSNDPNDWRLKIVVTGIKVDPRCERPNAAQRGHRVIVAVEVQTSPRYTEADGRVQYSDWSTIGVDGVSEPSMSTLWACNESKELFTDFRPASKYRGEITVDTANTKGRVVYDDRFAWDYPG